MLTRWIRWKGLIAFFVITAAMAAFWLLLADPLVKLSIEKAGTSSTGAKVELKSADLSLFPLGLTLRGLEVTNPDEPMRNAIEAGRIAFLMDSGMLLHGKVIIDEMSAGGLRFDTERKSSGAIKRKKKADSNKKAPDPSGEKAAGLGSAGFEVPDTEEILKNEELVTLRLADEVSSEIKSKEDEWDKRLKSLPDSTALKEFESRYKAIEKKFKGSTRDKLNAVSDAKDLQKDIKAARDKVNRAATDLETDYKKLRADINSTLKAPSRDLRRLKEKYQISAKGAGNLSSLIFGQKINEYIQKALSVYSLAEPFMKSPADEPARPERHKGTDVVFREFRPAPAFWAKEVKTDLILASGPVSGTVRDLSSDQGVTGRPVSFDLSAEGLEGTRSIEIKGGLDHRDSQSPRDELTLDIKGRAIDNMKLSGSGDMPVTIKKGLSDTMVKATLGPGGSLRSTSTIRVHSASIESSPSGSAMSKAMGRAISKLDGFSVSVNVSGTLSDYKVSVSSDIDDVLKTAVGKLLKEESDRFEAELRGGIKEKTDERLAGLKSELRGIEDKRSVVSGSSGNLESLLKKSSGIKAEKLLRF